MKKSEDFISSTFLLNTVLSTIIFRHLKRVDKMVKITALIKWHFKCELYDLFHVLIYFQRLCSSSYSQCFKIVVVSI